MDKAIFCDLELCIGCGACSVACMDENDVDVSIGCTANRRIHCLDNLKDESEPIRYVSVSCMHCDDSPCLIGCPTGAIYRDPQSNAVMVDQDSCIGCHSCALACPFGVPRYDNQDKLTKCDHCAQRLNAGLIPACVRVCPIGALSMMTPNEATTSKEGNYVGRLPKRK